MADKKQTQPLTPANQNPWYVLMTLYGEQTGEEIDRELHKKNRAAWNAWSCQRMSAEDRVAAAKSSGVSVMKLADWESLNGEITRLHEAEMRTRNGAEFAYPGLPEIMEHVVLSKVIFEHPLCCDRMVFSRSAWFEFAAFSGDAWFDAATFGGDAWFHSAAFSRNAWFRSTTFGGDAQFISATFGDYTYFSKATFGVLGQNHWAQFGNSQFQKPTNFRGATFHSSYPDFSGTMLHEKTTFTAKPAHWPKTASDPVAAKAACAIMRHCVGKQGLPEDKHFFYRREMGFGTQIGGLQEKATYFFFDWLSEFGHSIE
jgi:hypothetical protein